MIFLTLSLCHWTWIKTWPIFSIQMFHTTTPQRICRIPNHCLNLLQMPMPKMPLSQSNSWKGWCLTPLSSNKIMRVHFQVLWVWMQLQNLCLMVSLVCGSQYTHWVEILLATLARQSLTTKLYAKWTKWTPLPSHFSLLSQMHTHLSCIVSGISPCHFCRATSLLARGVTSSHPILLSY